MQERGLDLSCVQHQKEKEKGKNGEEGVGPQKRKSRRHGTEPTRPKNVSRNSVEGRFRAQCIRVYVSVRKIGTA